ncbi:hypothetical protein FWD07_02575 [Candidatus Saccharibacteria bacterium]|nr:hypothetical protein [Candidatus Saccharibacteria bacterium]
MNPSVDTNVSVCPAGWRLPTAGADGGTMQNNSTNEFWNLNQAVNGGLTTTDAGLRTQWLGMHGGNWFDGNFVNTGDWGFYWSSTQSNAGSARHFSFNTMNASFANGSNKQIGLAVRCIAEPVYIQEINESNCPVERTMAVDARDNRTYWVQKMGDGRCWMQTNLAYAGGGDNRFGDVVNLVNDEITGSWSSANFMRPPGDNPTTFPQAPSTSTTGIGQYGYLYNWCAAMGGQSAACINSTNSTDPNISICPAGWRLPTGTVDFNMLNNAVNNDLTDTDVGLRTQWLGMYSGAWWNGNFGGGIGQWAGYWTSYRSTAGTADLFSFSEWGVSFPPNPADKRGGYSVRCIAEPPSERIYIQEINDLNCPATRTMVVDARDNRTYWVQRMPDGRCWMQTNLAYAGGGDNRFGDVMNLNNDNLMWGPTIASFMRPLDANPTTYPVQPSQATDGGLNPSGRQFGYMYNWCAAMGGQVGACATGGGTIGVIDDQISICPAGWRLPKHNWPDSLIEDEFTDLNNSINNGNTNTDLGLRTYWLGMYAGNWMWDNLWGSAQWGSFWSSTGTFDGWGWSINTMEMISGLGWGIDTVALHSNHTEMDGISVRCVANPVQPEVPFIQEINQLNCPTERTMVVDARDNRTYWVQRMDDGRCWMQTNLAYAGGGDNRFGDVVNGLVENINNSFTEARLGRPTGANPTTYPTAPSTATDGGANISTRQFGYLYNWCAAMGNQQGTSACMNTVAPLPDPSVSVCPAGWRLPTGIPTTGEVTLLNNVANSGLTNTDIGLLNNWLGMRGGGWSNGAFVSTDIWGSYWTSTQSGATGARRLTHHSSGVTPGNWDDKQLGRAVRCIAEPVYLQEVNRDNCPTERTMVVDARDDRTYWIQRMPDGECWMQTNLAYAGGGDNRFGDVVSLTNNQSTNSYTSANFMRHPDANPTTFPQAPSTATDGGVDPATRQYGYLYNWCAAMGNQQGTGACLNGTMPAPNQGISICPAGWRLPVNHPTTGNEFALLNNAVNGGLTNTDVGLRTSWLGVYANVWWGGSFLSPSPSGRYWSSTQASGTQANIFSFSPTSVSASAPFDKQFGHAVRCITAN